VDDGCLDYLEAQKNDKSSHKEQQKPSGFRPSNSPLVSTLKDQRPDINDLDLPKGITTLSGVIAGAVLTRVVIGVAASTFGVEIVIGSAVGFVIGLALDLIHEKTKDKGR